MISGYRCGSSGNIFRFGDEPDLDRIIRFQNPVALRSHSPPMGVIVFSANYYSSLTTYTRVHTGTGESLPELLGAQVDLLDNPKYMGCNNLISPAGEPIDPFHLKISNTYQSQNISYFRKVKEDPMKPFDHWNTLDRKLCYRWPSSPTAAPTDEVTNWQLAQTIATDHNITTPIPQNGIDLWTSRINDLQTDLKNTNPNDVATIGLLQGRLWDLNNCIDLKNQALLDTIKNTRLAFRVQYQHTVSGEMQSTTPLINGRYFKPVSDSWNISYNMCHMDSDAQACMINGVLLIPVNRLTK